MPDSDQAAEAISAQTGNVTTGAVSRDPETGSASPLRRLLGSRAFIALFISNGLGFGGEQMRLAAQSWWILDEGGTSTEVGLAAGLRILPVIVLTLYAGVLIDRIGGRRILLAERWTLFVLALATALVLISGRAETWHIIVLSTLAGAMIALGTPATQTIVPELVTPDLRQSANSLNQLGNSLGRTFGPMLAGILIAARGAGAAFFGLTGIYAVSTLVTYLLPDDHKTTRAATSPFRQVMDGLSYIRGNPPVMWTSIVAFNMMFYTFIFPAIPVFAREVLEVGEIGYGWMWGAMAIGQGVSAVYIASRGGFSNKPLGMVLAGTAWSFGSIAFGLSENYALSVTILFFMGLAIPVWITSMMTLLQNHTAAEYRGRVMAVFAISQQSVSLGWLLGGTFLEVVGHFETLLIGAVGAIAMLATAMLASRDFRQAR